MIFKDLKWKVAQAGTDFTGDPDKMERWVPGIHTVLTLLPPGAKNGDVVVLCAVHKDQRAGIIEGPVMGKPNREGTPLAFRLAVQDDGKPLFFFSQPGDPTSFD